MNERNPIRAARLQLGLTQIQLALRTRRSLSTIRLAERGVVSKSTLTSIAAVLNLPVDRLLGHDASTVVAR